MEARTITTGQSSKDDGVTSRGPERERLDAAERDASSDKRTAAAMASEAFPADLF